MPLVISDVVDAGWTEDRDGLRNTITYLAVDQASGNPRLLPEKIPKRGDPHPTVPALRASMVTSSPAKSNPKQWNVRVEYIPVSPEAFPELGLQRLELDASIVEEQTITDVNGTRLSVDFLVGGAQVTHLPKATTLTNLMTVKVTRWENVSDLDLILRSEVFTGSVNSAPWFNWPAKSWKLDDLEARESDAGQVYREVGYVLTYNPKTWRLQVGFTLNGAVPAGAVEGEGFQTFDVIRLENFSLLPITIPVHP